MCRRCDRKDDAVRLQTAVSDVVPTPFHNRVDRQLQCSAMIAGQLTRLAARALDGDVHPEDLDRRVVAVQLIYEGLKLTRTLARVPPWEDDHASDGDIDVLVADVLVARGFALLARTEAAPEAVETIRGLARDETNRTLERSDSDVTDRALEADVFELSIVAGVTATGADRPTGTSEFATALAESMDDEPTGGDARLSQAVIEGLEEFVGD